MKPIPDFSNRYNRRVPEYTIRKSKKKVRGHKLLQNQQQQQKKDTRQVHFLIIINLTNFYSIFCLKISKAMSHVPGHISSGNSGYSVSSQQQGQGSSNFKNSEVGGYDVNFVDRANPDYQCPICQFTFRDPVQTRDCGHRFCETCLEPILR